LKNIVGREDEIRSIEKYYYSGRPELVIIYGRRRVGKTYLIREIFENNFSFYFTGSIDASNSTNLANFDTEIMACGGDVQTKSKNWSDAFEKLKNLLNKNKGARKVVFIDEMPWLDAHKSDFLSAFDYFWNSWASANPDIFFIGCGSATAWITKHIFQNRGGLHNRVTGRIYLAPFTIGECELFFERMGVIITRYQLAECYMIFGGIPYYLSLFEKGLSFSQNVDKLCFAPNAPLKNEFEELYHSLFKNPLHHIKIVETLTAKKSGMTRKDLCDTGGLQENGHLTRALKELEQCGFIESFSDFTKKKSGTFYFLKDAFTLFYIRYIRNNNTKDMYFWTNYAEDGGHRAWSGYAFELLCRIHLSKIKEKLGISGVSTNTATWRSKDSTPSVQIDLLVSRRDGVVNLCEIKYSKHPYKITKDYGEKLEYRKMVFAMETGCKHALHTTMITTFGLTKNGYFGAAQSEVTLDDLF